MRIFCASLLTVLLTSCSSTTIYEPRPLKLVTSLSDEQMKDVITSSILATDWEIKDHQEGRFVAQFIFNQHIGEVEILYSPTFFDVTYLNSVMLDYNPETKKIHEYYNQRVKQLHDTIKNNMFSTPITVSR